jgi:hypothetical protein
MSTQPEAIYARHAAIITVISMQLIVVYQPDQYDIWDFFISFLCLIFAIETFKIGYSDSFERILVASNLGVSVVYSLFVPACYLLYFAVQILGFQSAPSWIFDKPLSEAVVIIDFPGRYYDDFLVAELVVPIFVFAAYRWVRPKT